MFMCRSRSLPYPNCGCMQAKKPVLYIGGGCLGSSEEVQELVRRTGIPVAQTLMGLGAFPESHPLALQVQLGLAVSALRQVKAVWPN